jgi:chaperonin cofactor prefoldin
MTDDLVERLRSWSEGDACLAPVSTKEMIDSAADRIEELQRQLAASDKQIKYLEDEIENLEYEMCEMENRS